MINAVGRDIPEEVLAATGKKVFEGAYAYDNYEYKKAAPTVRAMVDPNRSKMVSSGRPWRNAGSGTAWCCPSTTISGRETMW